MEELNSTAILEIAKSEPLKAVSIEKEIEPFLSDKVKSFWKNIFCSEENFGIGTDEDGKPHACFIHCNDKTFDDKPSSVKIEWLAKFINTQAELGTIGEGSLCPPFYMKLAKFKETDPNKFILCYYPITRIKNETLIASNNNQCSKFTKEGELLD
jgi:hypothetical protein